VSELNKRIRFVYQYLYLLKLLINLKHIDGYTKFKTRVSCTSLVFRRKAHSVGYKGSSVNPQPMECASRVCFSAAASAAGGARRRPEGSRGGVEGYNGLVGRLLRLLSEVGGGFRRCRGGGAPPSLSFEDEPEYDCSGGGPSPESEPPRVLAAC
jgi:hypothetical protein